MPILASTSNSGSGPAAAIQGRFKIAVPLISLTDLRAYQMQVQVGWRGDHVVRGRQKLLFHVLGDV